MGATCEACVKPISTSTSPAPTPSLRVPMESETLEFNGNIVTKPSSAVNAFDAFAIWDSVTKFEIRIMETGKLYRIGLTKDASDLWTYVNGCYADLRPQGKFYYGGSYDMGDVLTSQSMA